MADKKDVERAKASELAFFEQWAKPDSVQARKDAAGCYTDLGMAAAWSGWMARARLDEATVEKLTRQRDELLAALNTQATKDVIAERQRQVEAEDWTPEHDDQHSNGQMAAAAGIYALHSGGYNMQMPDGTPSAFWPWAPEWWKPSDNRRNLVKAAALILAEIDRLDRVAIAKGGA